MNQELLKLVTEKVLLAGKLLAAEWDLPGGPRGYGDKAEALRRGLLDLLPCDFWGEETGTSLAGHEYCWVVDPNDGTSIFYKSVKDLQFQ